MARSTQTSQQRKDSGGKLPEGNGPLSSRELHISAPLAMLSKIEELLKALPVTVDQSGKLDLSWDNGKLVLSSTRGLSKFTIGRSNLIREVTQARGFTNIHLCEGPIEVFAIKLSADRSTSTYTPRKSQAYREVTTSTESSGGAGNPHRGENGW